MPFSLLDQHLTSVFARDEHLAGRALVDSACWKYAARIPLSIEAKKCLVSSQYSPTLNPDRKIMMTLCRTAEQANRRPDSRSSANHRLRGTGRFEDQQVTAASSAPHTTLHVDDDLLDAAVRAPDGGRGDARVRIERIGLCLSP